MILHAKNYETVTAFVKVMQKKNYGLFLRKRCSILAVVDHMCI